MEHHGFENFLVQHWQNNLALVPALQHLAGDLQKWNKKVFGNLFRRRRQIWARLNGVHKKLADGSGKHLLKLEVKLRRELDDVLNQIETFWFQKSRMAAIKDGDRNTRYFHLSTVIRRKYNRIESLQDGTGTWITESGDIKQLVLDYFSSLFTEPMPQLSRSNLLTGRFPPIHEEVFQDLCKPFTSKDVQLAL